MVSFRKIVSIICNPFRWYHQQTAHIEEEARKATRQALQRETDALISECTELEFLLEDNPFNLPALTQFSGEDDNRFREKSYYEQAVRRFNSFQLEVTTNDGLYRQHAGNRAVDEWKNMYCRFAEMADTYNTREAEKRQRELE